QANDLPPPDLQVDIVRRLDPAEASPKPAHHEDGLVGRRLLPLPHGLRRCRHRPPPGRRVRERHSARPACWVEPGAKSPAMPFGRNSTTPMMARPRIAM